MHIEALCSSLPQAWMGEAVIRKQRDGGISAMTIHMRSEEQHSRVLILWFIPHGCVWYMGAECAFDAPRILASAASRRLESASRSNAYQPT